MKDWKWWLIATLIAVLFVSASSFIKGSDEIGSITKPVESDIRVMIPKKVLDSVKLEASVRQLQDSISIEILKDSISRMTGSLAMQDRSWRYVQIKHYWSICQKNPKNKVYFYGWCSRVIQRK